MNKIKGSLPLLAFCVYFTKIVIIPASLVDSSILLILAAFIGYLEYKQNDKNLLILSEKINLIEKQSEEKIKGLTQQFEKKFEEMENIRASVTGMKLASSMRSGNSR